MKDKVAFRLGKVVLQGTKDTSVSSVLTEGLNSLIIPGLYDAGDNNLIRDL